MRFVRAASFFFITATVGLSACGTQRQTGDSQLMNGEPDFKAPDGTNILDWAKKPANAKNVCQLLSEMKAQGFNSYAQQSTAAVARQFHLHPSEAEIVATYVAEFSCPENR